jgi:hypothetical protein
MIGDGWMFGIRIDRYFINSPAGLAGKTNNGHHSYASSDRMTSFNNSVLWGRPAGYIVREPSIDVRVSTPRRMSGEL